MEKYPHVSVFRTLNRVLQKHCIQVVTPIVYSSIQFFRKSTGFFLQRKMHDHFTNFVILKGRLHSDSFLYVLYRSIIFKKAFSYTTCIILQCTQPFYPSNAQKNPFHCEKKIGISCSFAFLNVIT